MTTHDRSRTNLMPIGRFSNACRLSVKALRHYDDVDLLKPAFIDPDNGYRYYGSEQARDAVLIAMLRSLDIPLPTIRSLLHAESNTLRRLLEKERNRIAGELAKQQQVLNSIERIAREGDLVPYDIRVRVEPDYRLAMMHCRTNAERIVDESSELMYRLFDELASSGVEQRDPCMCINQSPDKTGCIIVQACVGVSTAADFGEAVEFVDVSGGPVAWLTHTGAYEELGIAYHALSAWAQERGHEQRDALREIYVNDPADTPTNALQTVVLLPINA